MEDLLHRFLTLFNRLPLPVRNMAGRLYNGLPKRVKYGSFYFTYLRRLDHFSGLESDEKIALYQRQILFNQINSVIDTVPFYSKYKKAEQIEDILSYPVIDKDIRRHVFCFYVPVQCANIAPEQRLPFQHRYLVVRCEIMGSRHSGGAATNNYDMH